MLFLLIDPEKPLQRQHTDPPDTSPFFDAVYRRAGVKRKREIGHSEPTADCNDDELLLKQEGYD